MKKTFRSLSLLGAVLALATLAANAATVYVPTDQAPVPRSPLISQTSDQPNLGMASYITSTVGSPKKFLNQVNADKMAGTRTPDKVVASRTPPVIQADANNLLDKKADSRMPATFQASALGAKHDIGVGGHQQVALVGSSPSQWRLKQVGSQNVALIKTGLSIPQPLTHVGTRSPVVVIT